MLCHVLNCIADWSWLPVCRPPPGLVVQSLEEKLAAARAELQHLSSQLAAAQHEGATAAQQARQEEQQRQEAEQALVEARREVERCADCWLFNT